MGSITSDSLPKNTPVSAGRVRRQVAAKPVPPVEDVVPDVDPLDDQDQDPVDATSEENDVVDSSDLVDEEEQEEEEEDLPPPPPTRVVHAGKPAMGRRARAAVVETTASVTPPSTEGPAKTHFRAILRDAASYTYNGMKFKRGIPVNVPMKYYKVFKSNGFFTIVG